MSIDERQLEAARKGAALGGWMREEVCVTCGGSGTVGRRGMSINPFSGIPAPDPQCDETYDCPDCVGELDEGAVVWRDENAPAALERPGADTRKGGPDAE